MEDTWDQAVTVSQIFGAENLKDVLPKFHLKVGGYSWPKIIQITDKSCIMIVYTRCWSQDIKENIWNAISFISHSMYKATYF